MMSDSLLLRMLRRLGSVRFRAGHGELEGIFDAAHVQVEIDDALMSDSAPQIACRTSDVKRLQLARGSSVEGPPGAFTVRDHQADGTGMSVLILDSA